MGERSKTVPLRPFIMSADKRALSSSDLAGAAAGVTAVVSGLKVTTRSDTALVYSVVKMQHASCKLMA